MHAAGCGASLDAEGSSGCISSLAVAYVTPTCLLVTFHPSERCFADEVVACRSAAFLLWEWIRVSGLAGDVHAVELVSVERRRCYDASPRVIVGRHVSVTSK
eukprot:jgi/Ulvmu1/1119/UM106_0036.1